MSIIYEVNLRVDLQIKDAFRAWLDEHIQEILTIDGFQSAKWLEVTNQADQKQNTIAWSVQYELRDQKALDHYLENHALRMRKPAKEKFGDRFEATRRVLKNIQDY